MSVPSCSKCGGTRWVRYFSETTNGDLEEAFRLCRCNQDLEMGGEYAREEPQRTESKARALSNPSDWGPYLVIVLYGCFG